MHKFLLPLFCFLISGFVAFGQDISSEELNEKINPQRSSAHKMMHDTKKTPLIQWGVKGGLNTQSLKLWGDMQQKVGNFFIPKVSTSGAGWTVGIVGRVNLGRFNIQPELLWWQNSYSLELHAENFDDIITTGDVVHRSLELPVVFGWKYSVFRLYLGPQFSLWNKKSYTMEHKQHSGSELVPFEEADLYLESPSVRFVCGVSFEFWHVTLDIRHINNCVRQSFRVTPLVEEEDVPNLSKRYDTFSNYWQFTLGLLF